MISASSVSLASATLVLAKSSILLALGYATARLLHRAPAAARHVAWLTAIVGVLLVPFFNRFTPLPVHVLPPAAAPIRLPTLLQSVAAPIANPPAAHAALAVAAVVHSPSVAQQHVALPPLLPLLVTTWAVVAFILVVRLIVGLAAVGRLVRRSRVLESDVWTRALESAARQLAVPVLPRLVMSHEVEMAFAFDAFAPTIVLPASAEEWSPERRRSVLLHELAHIRRRDLIGHAVAGVACAINWFNPFIWIAARELRIESELASDEIVLGAGVRPSVYAQHLLDMVTSVTRRAPNVALAMARPKEFEGRLVAILEPARRRGMAARRQGVAVAGLLAVSAVSIGAIAPVPRRVIPRSRQTATSASRVTSMDAKLPVTPLQIASGAQRALPARAQGRGAPPPNDRPIEISPSVVASATDAAKANELAAWRLSEVAVNTLVRYGTGAMINPMMLLLREADSLQLTGPQADSVATLNRLFTVELSQLWRDVSAYYVSHPAIPNERFVNDGARAAHQSEQLLIALLPTLNGLLTPEQRGRLSPTAARYLDARQIETAVANSPTGVFVPERELFGLFGRGRQGGGGSAPR